ncbi:FHA domain-containing protein [Microbulbifer celer]|uniref:FHA domain-containing protein n=1 Tax=Microbulbifer celer TaxID=435905 RepID=A0ABW3UDD9_9GAMM|nr:FHA domain-containing protein [Microbulbifer celer]UFN57601.1 FHA domain-containing protein [Microbulbifer celer]
MALIIEEINRAHRVHTRVRVDGERATLGRCFSNAVIVEDPHADPVHAELVRDQDGCYVLRDLGSLNGTRLLRNYRDKSVKAAGVREHLIQSGDEIEIGKSKLRFTDTETSVPPAVPLHHAETLFDRIATPTVAIGLCLLVAALGLWRAYLGTVQEFEWPRGVEVLTDSVIGLLVYAAIWSFIGRVVKHEAHFLAHLSIAAGATLLYVGWEWILALLNYNFSLAQVMPLLKLIAPAVLIPIMLWCAAFLALNIAPHWRLLASVLLPWGFLGLAAAMELGRMDEFSEIPPVSTALESDNRLWREPVPLEQFLAGTPALFDITIEQDEEDREAAPDEAEDDSDSDSTANNNTDNAG